MGLLRGCLLLGGGVSAPGGCLFLGGVCFQGGVCSRGVSVPGGCLLPGRPLLWAVHILLECILVEINFVYVGVAKDKLMKSAYNCNMTKENIQIN